MNQNDLEDISSINNEKNNDNDIDKNKNKKTRFNVIKNLKINIQKSNLKSKKIVNDE